MCTVGESRRESAANKPKRTREEKLQGGACVFSKKTNYGDLRKRKTERATAWKKKKPERGKEVTLLARDKNSKNHGQREREQCTSYSDQTVTGRASGKGGWGGAMVSTTLKWDEKETSPGEGPPRKKD